MGAFFYTLEESIAALISDEVAWFSIKSRNLFWDQCSYWLFLHSALSATALLTFSHLRNQDDCAGWPFHICATKIFWLWSEKQFSDFGQKNTFLPLVRKTLFWLWSEKHFFDIIRKVLFRRISEKLFLEKNLKTCFENEEKHKSMFCIFISEKLFSDISENFYLEKNLKTCFENEEKHKSMFCIFWQENIFFWDIRKRTFWFIELYLSSHLNGFIPSLSFGMEMFSIAQNFKKVTKGMLSVGSECNWSSCVVRLRVER